MVCHEKPIEEVYYVVELNNNLKKTYIYALVFVLLGTREQHNY